MVRFFGALLLALVPAVALATDTIVIGCFRDLGELWQVHDEILIIIHPGQNKRGPLQDYKTLKEGTFQYGDGSRKNFYTRKCVSDLSFACQQDEAKCKLEYVFGKRPAEKPSR